MKITLEIEITDDQARAIEFDIRRMTTQHFESHRRPRPKAKPSLHLAAGWLKLKAQQAVSHVEYQATDYDRIQKQFKAPR